MIRDAVVLAAGLGSRISLDDNSPPKPLLSVGGMPLVKRTLLTLAAGGVTRACVVIGHMGERIRAALAGDAELAAASLQVEFVENPDYRLANGVSVVAARACITGPFVLSMSDHVYDVDLARLAVQADLRDADLFLCVDRRLDEIYDMDDATKVRTQDGRIVDIGKTIANYDCIDCGVFAVGPALLDALAAERQRRGDCSLSDGVRVLAERGRARVLDIGNAFWQDVDTLGAAQRAESILAGRASH